MSEENRDVQEAESALDSLLDEALEDFNKPPQKVASNSSNLPSNNEPQNSEVWTEEFIQQATKQFESNIRQMMQNQQQENVQTSAPPFNPTPTSSALPNDFGKLAEAAAKSAVNPPPDVDFASCLASTMQQLNQNAAEAQAPPSADDLEKMFENFSLGSGLGFGGAEGNSTAGGFFPVMQTMMENILAKDVLYAPVKEITSKYPDWLADNGSTLSEEDFQRYNKQYDVMKKVASVFEEESENDSSEVKAKNFEEVLQLMQQLQELGQPPKDIVGDFGPTINFDASGNPMMPDLSSLLSSAGFPSTEDGTSNQDGEPTAAGGKSDQEPCSLM